MTHVTVPDASPTVSYTVVASSTGPFVIPFAFTAKEDVQVVVGGVALNGAQWTLTASPVTGGYQTGVCSLAAPVSNTTVVIYRDVPASRTSDFAAGPLPKDAINTALDRLTMHVQDRELADSRALRAPVGETIAAIPAASARAQKSLIFDINGDPTVGAPLASGTVSGPMSSVVSAASTDAAAALLNAAVEVADIPALRAKTWSGASRPDIVVLIANWAAGDGGGIFRWDAASALTDDGGVVVKEAATGTGRWLRQFSGALDARWFGVRADGATADTAALQAGVNAAAGRTLSLPPGVIISGAITISSALRIEGNGADITIVRRASGTNNRLFYSTGVNDIQFAGFTLDGNPTQNTGSGAHDGIRFEGGASRWVVERMKITGWRGTFSGSPVGAGLVAIGGADGRMEDCHFTDSYDGYTLIGHGRARSYGVRTTLNQRFGGLVDDNAGTGSDSFEQYGTTATDNSTVYAGAGVAILDSKYCKTFGGVFSTNTLGHGLQHNGSNFAEVHGAQGDANGISGIDFFNSLEGKIFGCGAANNTIRGLEIDTASNGCVVYGFRGAGNGDVDLSVFRSADVTLRDCEGNVRAWDTATVATAAIAAAGSGYTNGTFTCTVVGGTRRVAATLSVTVTAGAVTGVSVLTAGDYWTLPTNPVTVTGLSAGSGATFNLTWTGANSATCARLSLDGGAQADTVLIASGSALDVRVRALRATTISDPGNHIIDATASPQSLQRGFVAHKNGTNQTGIAATTDTKLTFSTTTFNHGGRFDTANSRWTPPAGMVRLTAQAIFSAGTSAPGLYMVQIFKNGSALRKAYDIQSAGSPLCVQVDVLDVANGTDFYEAWVWGQSAGTLTIDGNAQITFFQGHLL